MSEKGGNAQVNGMSTTNAPTRVDTRVDTRETPGSMTPKRHVEPEPGKRRLEPEPGYHLLTPPEGIALKDACRVLGLSPGTFRRLLREYEGIPGLPGAEAWGSNGEVKKGLIKIGEDGMKVLKEIVHLRQQGKAVNEIKEVLLKGNSNSSADTALKDAGTVHKVDNALVDNGLNTLASEEGFKGIAEAAATSEAVRDRPDTGGAQYTQAAVATVSESTQIGLDLSIIDPANWKLNLKEYTDGTQNDLIAHLEHLARALNRSEERRARDRDRLMTALMRTQQEIQQLRYELVGQRSRRQRKRGFLVRLLG
ncbi:MAG TPA: hypothetical protein GX507_09035 [Clostridia bacterium]|nr:hypothetical protein [Clostridia bacterium]